jgi:hypothetical protein
LQDLLALGAWVKEFEADFAGEHAAAADPADVARRDSRTQYRRARSGGWCEDGLKFCVDWLHRRKNRVCLGYRASAGVE